MFGGDEIDVMTAHRLELKHHRCQHFRRSQNASLELADVVVLAENAAQITHAEENGSGSFPTTQAVFLPMVGKMAGNSRVAASLAYRGLVRNTVHLAVPRTYTAFAERSYGLCCTPFYLL